MDAAAFAAWVRSRHSIDVDWYGEVSTTSVASSLRTELDRLIVAGDRKGVAVALETFRKAWLDGEDPVRSSLIISGLSKVRFTDTRKVARAWAWELVPEVLRLALADYEAYMEELLSRPLPKK